MFKWSGLFSVGKYIAVIALICFFFGLSYGEIMLDKVVAVVNAEVITWSELYKTMEFEATPEVKALSGEERRKIFKENEAVFLENLINTKLILQAARTARVVASEAEVEQTIKNIKTKYRMNDEDFSKTIAKEGFTLKEYKKQLAEQIIASKLMDFEVRSKVVVTDKEVADHMLRNKDDADEGYVISLILVKKSDNPKADEEKIGTVYEKLKAGAAFADIARQYSDDSSSSRAGGNKGFVRSSDLSREFVEAISKLKKGEVSGPFMTPAGINIVKLEDSRVFTKEGDVKSAIREKLFTAKLERAYKAWIKGLRQTAYVEIR
jgi:peptidyl-prolyl cis-trans isomerase SurA